MNNSTPQPFRTATGQTGRDAYIFEAQAIANAQRVLDQRFKALRETIAREAPETFHGETDFMWAGASAAQHFSDYLVYGPERAAEIKHGGKR